MTFVEELKQLSASVALRHKLERQLTEIKSKMKTAASNGYRGFKIDVINVLETKSSIIRLPDINAENYYYIFTTNESFYIDAIIKFLNELGFSSSDITLTKHNDGYSATLINIIW